MTKKFIPPEGHEDCMCTSCIAECVAIGRGECDEHGFWEEGCYECARAWEEQFPEDGEVWPFSEATLFRGHVEKRVEGYEHPKKGRPDRIVAAAIYKNGNIWTGKRHAEIMYEVVKETKQRVFQDEQGFWSANGWWMRRPAALTIALENGQIESVDKLINKGVLTSEDLW